MSLVTGVIERLERLWFTLRQRNRCRHIGDRVRVVRPFRFDGAAGISIGARSFIQRDVWLYAIGLDSQPATLSIGRDCVFGYRNHIAAVREVTIGDAVLTANNVYISDNLHGYEDTATPIMHQPVRFKAAVSIGDGTWIGENVCIIGARIGRNCVIGANAVVTRDVPDYSVVAGIPAVVIRQFDPVAGCWKSMPPRGQ